ncbi:MAG: thermonuclease family protein [archaeon]
MVKRRVKEWHDGDSGIFANGTRFRLDNVRAPELYQFGGPTAKKSAAGMTGKTNQFVDWKRTGKDKYGREIGKMSNKHGSVNERLRKKGYKNKGR